MGTTAAARAFPPGEYLRDELQARGLSAVEFARVVDWPLQTLSEILVGEKEITVEAAQALAEALGTTPEVWLNLQRAYRRHQRRAIGGPGT